MAGLAKFMAICSHRAVLADYALRKRPLKPRGDTPNCGPCPEHGGTAVRCDQSKFSVVTKNIFKALVFMTATREVMSSDQAIHISGFITAPFKAQSLALCVAFVGMPCISNAQTPAEDVAAQVRLQGYRCDQPITARRDSSLSKPDSAVWFLKCRNASYRVRLDPDMAARIIKLKKKSQ
jgi:hypothetical protein